MGGLQSSMDWRLWHATKVSSVVDEQDAHGVCVCRETDNGPKDGTERAPTGISKEEHVQRLHEFGKQWHQRC